MSTQSKFFALFVGLSLALVITMTIPHNVRTNPGMLYAAPTVQGSGDCSSWADACTMQTALTNAISGDEIWVEAGVHKPTATTDRTISFILKDGVAVYGGFAGTETSRNQRDWQANITILSGDIDNNDINTDGNFIAETPADIQGSNSYHVVTSKNATNTAVLDGFIITAGQANGSDPNDSGGGMYNSSSSLMLTNIILIGNTGNYGGGGMYNEYGSPTLINVTFSGNSAVVGGGLYNFYCQSPRLINVVFNSNTATYAGGGMESNSSTTILTDVKFIGNTANSSGGGMDSFYDSPTLVNVAFIGNAANNGGGFSNSPSSPTLTNVTFSGNTATNAGGGMYNYTGTYFASNPTLTNVIIWGNNAPNGPEIYNHGTSNATIAYSDIQGCGGSGEWNSSCGTNGSGNIDTDPHFVNAVLDNLRLQLNSPAIDAGDNTAVPPDVATDLDSNPRFVDIPSVPDTGNGTPPIVDMGAYEAINEAINKIYLPLLVRNAP